MKHRFWVQPWWGDLGHCKCCSCGKGAYPIGGAEGIGGIDGPVLPGDAHFCKYGKDCKLYSNTTLFFVTLTGKFIAWKEEDYDAWVRHSAKRAIRKQ